MGGAQHGKPRSGRRGRFRRFLLFVFVCVCAYATVVALAGCGGSRAGAAAGEPAPASSASQPVVDFTFDSLDGRPVSAGSTRGKPTVIAFVTTASLLSQAQVDFLVAMAKNDADRVNYAVVALEARESLELVQLYTKALSIAFPVAMADPETLVGSGPFGDVRAVPVTVLLDRNGRLAWRADGRVANSTELRGVLRRVP